MRKIKLTTNHQPLNTKPGFTFIELLVVVTIIAVLAAIGMVSYRSANIRSRDGKRKADLEQIRAALEMYRADNSVYPNTAALQANLVSTYISTIPSPPPGSKCSGSSIASYDVACVYTRNTTTTYTIKVDLEAGGTYSQTNP